MKYAYAKGIKTASAAQTASHAPKSSVTSPKFAQVKSTADYNSSRAPPTLVVASVKSLKSATNGTEYLWTQQDKA